MVPFHQHAQPIGATERTARLVTQVIGVAPRDSLNFFTLGALEHTHIEKPLRETAVDTSESPATCPAMRHGIDSVIAHIALGAQPRGKKNLKGFPLPLLTFFLHGCVPPKS